jgi:bleomycin hydrolase
MKYGVVPKEAMPETYSSENTSRISHLLALKLREDGLKLRDAAAKGASAKKLEQQKVEMLAEVYHILTLAYGVPPTQFSWKRRDASGKVIATEQYTPKEFYAALWGEDLTADYVMLMNDPTRPYYNMYKIDYDRHTYDGHDWTYLNLPIEEIKPMAIASIRDSAAMYFSCDVGKYLYSASGTLDLDNYDYASLLGTSFTMNKEQRIRTHASASSHAMTLVGVDVIDTTTQKVGKWLVENSWGAASGWKGHLIMTDQWFDEYMFRLVVNRKYLSDKYRALLQQKAILLPAWDPMFQPEE